jgi:hypothetical protein
MLGFVEIANMTANLTNVEGFVMVLRATKMDSRLPWQPRLENSASPKRKLAKLWLKKWRIE